MSIAGALSGAPGAAMATAVVARIDGRVEPYEWPFARDESERIDARWAEIRRTKPALFDGRVLMARRPALVEGRLACASFVTGYKPFLCWRERGYPQDDADPVFNLFAMPALQAADGAFMLGRMSAGTANGGRLYFPAGTPEPGDAGPEGWVDFDGNILRELQEETGIAPGEVSLDARWTLVLAGPLIACMKVVRSPLAAAGIEARVAAFLAGQSDPELDGLHAVAGLGDLDPARMPPFMVHYLREALGGV